ncbi:MAG: cellulase family glycosylhydrolase, partial [Solirubrobacteraceae bacterium]
RHFVASPGWGDGYTSRAVQIAIHHFFTNDVTGDLQGQYAHVWTAVARHFRNNPNVIGYEVYNEPNDFLVKNFNPELSCDYGGWAHEPKSCLQSHTQPVPDGLIGAIERSGGDHLVFFEPSGATDYGVPETLGISAPLRFPRLALAFHVYGSIPQQLAQTAGERDRTRTEQPGGPGWIMDEFGGTGLGPPTAQAVSAADAIHLSWAYWSAMQLDDPTGAGPDEGLLDQQTRLPYLAVAHALAVPYPWATAGEPGGQSFNYAGRSFHYSYLPDYKIRAPTEISVPGYTYPHGYAVRLHGAKMVSRPGAAVLEVVAKRPPPPRRHRRAGPSKPRVPAPPTPVTVTITPR